MMCVFFMTCAHNYLPPDVCELGKQQRQIERQLQYIVIMDVHSQWLHKHTKQQS